MKVSVLTPIYRTDPAHLREMIRSVLAQTFGDFELLLLDDCPEDRREAVVREFADPRIVYLQNERNLGIARSRNRLLDEAKGEYLAILDHDDVCRADRLERQVAYLDAHPETGVVSSWTRVIPKGVIQRQSIEDEEIRLAMMRGCCVWHPAAMVRSSVLSSGGVRYEPGYSPAEDYLLWLKLLGVTKFHNLPEPLTDYRWHDTNVSVLQRERLAEMAFKCRAWARVHLPELWREYEFRRTDIWQVRVFGLPLVKVVRRYGEWKALLFGKVPCLSLKRRSEVRK